MSDDQPTVRDNPDQNRFEISLDGALAGHAQYVRRGGRIYFVHTEIEEGHEGAGLGSALARGALDATRERGEPVVPLCPFIRAYIDRHPEYAELVDSRLLAHIDGDDEG